MCSSPHAAAGVPGREAEAIGRAIPSRPQLARMRFLAGSDDAPVVERDAYSFLRLLVAHEGDFAATWENHLGQPLSVDLLLGHAWQRYLEEPSTRAEERDHSYLHLVEILLAYVDRAAEDGTRRARFDANAIKRRFLAGELARPVDEVDDERLVHYAESLGWLLANSRVTWDADEQARAAGWLRELEEDRFADLEDVKAGYLSHLLRGLRMVRSHEDRLRPN